jgi:phosphate starvation-inducible protein PhoH and related proteins
LSRARGAKAQRRQQQHQQQAIENTISFHQTARTQHRPIDLVPKTRGQERLVLSLQNPEVAITVAVGPAGTGKTYLAMQAAIRALRAGEVKRIILTRPAVGVEDEQHGFLPGDLMMKMEPWTRPLLDVVREYYHPRDIVRMMEDQVIEISPLAYMRGRTFKNAWIIADEMQNATPGQMKMLLSRIGQDSKIVVTGDVEQADRKNHDNGLLDLAQRLKSQEVGGLDIVQLTGRDIQRHPMISSILALYQE